LDHLFENEESDLLISRKDDGSSDQGFFAIKASEYSRFLDALESPIEPSLADFFQFPASNRQYSGIHFQNL